MTCHLVAAKPLSVPMVRIIINDNTAADDDDDEDDDDDDDDDDDEDDDDSYMYNDCNRNNCKHCNVVAWVKYSQTIYGTTFLLL